MRFMAVTAMTLNEQPAHAFHGHGSFAKIGIRTTFRPS
jgi:hypothetical protein